MKKVALISPLIFFVLNAAILFTVSTPASAASLMNEEEKTSATLEYKKSGFHLGGELSGLIGIGEVSGGAFGKLDFIAGYQFNPYISLNADLWTFWFLAYGVEINPKINFIDAKISPFVTASFGIASVFLLDDSDNTAEAFLTYSAGAGVDIHLSRHGTLYAFGKYRGGTNALGDIAAGDVAHGVEFGVGFRWLF